MAVEAWLDAQYSVLGSGLICPELVPKILRETREEDFSGTCLTVYRALKKLFQEGSPVDIVSVNAALGSGYREFLVQLMDITPTAANLDRYLELCREQARTGRLRELAARMAREEDGEKLRALMEQASGLLVQQPALKITTMADAMDSFLERHSRETRYLTWPVPELDRRIYAEPGDFIIIGGHPSTGKSAWALQCAWHWARNYRVGFFSLETSSEKLFDRQMAAAARLSMDTIKRNALTQADWDRVCTLSGEVTTRNLELIPAAGMGPADVRAVTVMRGYQIICIDYLQLLQSPGENRTAQVTRISMALHTLAQSLGVTVVALSQLSRPSGSDRNTPPDLSSLRESGQIEQDADLVMLLSLQDRNRPGGPRELRIRKNKEGTCPNILLDFDGKFQTFSRAGGKQPPRPEPAALPQDTPVPF